MIYVASRQKVCRICLAEQKLDRLGDRPNDRKKLSIISIKSLLDICINKFYKIKNIVPQMINVSRKHSWAI
ncbi:hypothetical protein BpHYR1_010247 [Brachionus plicatilis]|uniref:Uncharacterized protein n=1 Tax=Brachionus plicatilis TaxID=10195 RepID=A0A3M7SSJ4_BRAPC|nr:hypothetical protein BpHYR1_010247 [Brachionus plicatilis]